MVAAKAVLIALFLAAPAAAQLEGDVIYGDDDRLDLYQIQDARLLKLADSSVGLFHADKVHVQDPDGEAHLVTQSYSEKYNLCPDEPFFSQRTGAFCSGSLVGPDLVMTAGHCVRTEAACKATKFVFGFAVKQQGRLPGTVPAADVFGCKQILGREEASSGADWALIRLDRPVTRHQPLAISRTGTIAKKTPLMVIGHPAGLPTKVAGGASVRNPDPNGYFVANLDTYGGNSGSAVFNAKSGLIEGILVRGEQDYEQRGSCMVSKVCPNDGCRGEEVTKISVLSSRIPRTKETPAPQSNVLKAAEPGPALAQLIELLNSN